MSEVIGPAATGTAVAGRAPPLTLILDMNGDGTPDYEEPKWVVAMLGAIAGFFAPLIPPHTLAGQLANQVLTKVLPAVAK